MLPTGRRITHSDITPEDEADLIQRFQAGDRTAGGLLVQAHDRLIYQKVRRYFNKGLDKEDVLQWGRVGFAKGIVKFDPARGKKLTTYALWWSRHEACRAIKDEGSTIRIPTHVHDRLYKAARSGAPLDKRGLEALLLRKTSSIDVPMGNDFDGGTLRELAADGGPGPEATVTEESAQVRRRELISRAMTWLTARERELVERRLLADEGETLADIGASWNVSRERARQIEVIALGKLRMAMRMLMSKDDAVLWGGELPAGPMPPRQVPVAPPSPAVEPAPASRTMAAPKRRRAKLVAVLPMKAPSRRAANDPGAAWESASR